MSIAPQGALRRSPSPPQQTQHAVPAHARNRVVGPTGRARACAPITYRRPRVPPSLSSREARLHEREPPKPPLPRKALHPATPHALHATFAEHPQRPSARCDTTRHTSHPPHLLPAPWFAGGLPPGHLGRVCARAPSPLLPRLYICAHGRPPHVGF